MRSILFALLFLASTVVSGANFTSARGVVAQVLVQTPISASTGSAVLIAEDTWLSSAHLFTIRGSIEIHTRDGKQEGRLIKIDSKNDLALVQAKASCPCATMAAASAVIDEEILAVGFPHGTIVGTQFATTGHSQGVDKGGQLIFSANVAPGMSGGGIFVFRNNRWELVAITKAILSIPVNRSTAIPVHWIAYSVPLPTIRTFLSVPTQNPASPSLVQP